MPYRADPSGTTAATDRAGGAGQARPGFTVAELLVVLTLLAILAALLFSALAANVRLARVLGQRVLDADAVRTATTVLGGELRRAAPDDLLSVAADSLALRAFRGVAIPCGATTSGMVVHFRGDRLPDPAKDSALWISRSAPPLPVAITAAQPFPGPGCPGPAAGQVHAWRTTPAVAEHGLLLLFESGTYHLANHALRYRIGAAGRQPITADAFSHPATSFALTATAAVEIRLALTSTPAFISRMPIFLHTALPDSI